jgi:dTDP-glucose 4,6-dehydratase
MGDRYAVVGSNSFSGSHFVAQLLGEGHEVLGLSRSSEVDEVFRPYAWRARPGSWTFLQADLNDTKLVAESLGDFRPDVVVNFAAQSMVAQSWEFPEHWYQTNVLGLVELAKVLEKLPGLEKYVHVTTPEVYGSTGGWIAESNTFRPSTPYAISRAAGDMHLLAMHETRGLPVCFTRAANVYGPGQQLYRIVPRTLLYARLGRQLRLDGGGHSTRSFIHIADVAEATYAIAERGIPGESYHISTDEIVSIRELVERACDLTGISFAELVVEGPERPGKDDTYMLDSAHLRSELAWAPAISLGQGMSETLAWIDDNLGVLAEAPDSYVHKK